jgi:hypothetical protein
MSVLFDQTTNRCAIIESVNWNTSGYSLGSFCATIQVTSHRVENSPKEKIASSSMQIHTRIPIRSYREIHLDSF